MRLSFLPISLVVVGGTQLVSAAALPAPSLAPALPLSEFNHAIVKPLTLEQALTIQGPKTESSNRKINLALAAAATCSSPRVRMDWDSLPTADKTAFVNALKCLLKKPASGAFSQAKNRYEDFVALHQSLTPNVHGNSKFLVWHRYLLWSFEDVLRTECSWGGSLPWFDESKYAGKFSTSSIFSASWFGGMNFGGGCVTNGQFANLALNVGPGPSNAAHCLARNGDESKTANTNAAMVSACNSRTDYADMAACAEGGAHAWGHNGIGAVMQDTYASPGDPLFWLHHAFIDRNYRIWQNGDASRITYIDGTDRVGNPLTLTTGISVNGIRPNVVIGDVINTLGTKMCYKYNY